MKYIIGAVVVTVALVCMAMASDFYYALSEGALWTGLCAGNC